MALAAPEPLRAIHVVDTFDCGWESLDQWLKHRAWHNQAGGASKTYVVCHGLHVVAYYSLAAGSVSSHKTTGRFRRNMPKDIPVVLLGRLGVDKNYQKQGIGRALIRDAGMRVIMAADTVGVRGMIVHALNEQVRAFYMAIGFEVSPIDPLTLFITLNDLRAALDVDQGSRAFESGS